MSPVRGDTVWEVVAKVCQLIALSMPKKESNEVERKKLVAGIGGLVVLGLIAYLFLKYPISTGIGVAVIAVIMTFVFVLRGGGPKNICQVCGAEVITARCKREIQGESKTVCNLCKKTSNNKQAADDLLNEG